MTGMCKSARGWECHKCGAWMRDPEHASQPPLCGHTFPGHEHLRMASSPSLPGETLSEYHLRVYDRQYLHGDHTPGTTLVGEAVGT